MAFTSNLVMLDGFMAGTPEQRPNNGPCIFQLSTGRRVKNKETGQYETKYQYIDCKAWGDLRDILAGITDGQHVLLVGSLDREEWEDKETKKKRYKLVVQADTIGEVRKIEKQEEQTWNDF